MSFLALPPFGPEPGEVCGRAKLEIPGMLRPRRFDGFLQVLLHLDPAIRVDRAAKIGPNAVELSVVSVRAATFRGMKALIDQLQTFTGEPRLAQHSGHARTLWKRPRVPPLPGLV